MAARVPNRVTSVAYKLAKPVPIKAEGPIPADLIEKLQAKFNFSDSIVAELKRHTRIDPSYPNALRGDLLRGLLILLEQELSPDNITAIANQLIEGAPQCTQGFHNRVNELVTGFVTPKNISELLYQIRGDIVRKAARTLSDDVHVNNSFFKVANLEKYGIEQINVHDEYWGSKPYPAIRSALERTFSSDFQYIDVLALLSKMAKSVLIMRAGYSGRRPVGDPYKAEYYNKFEALLGGIPFELPGGIREFAVFDEDTYEVYDLNWNHINQLLFKKLCTDRFLELSNETTKIINQIFEDEDKVLSAEDCQALSDLDLKHLLRLLSLMDSNHHQKILSLIDAHMNRSDDPAHRMTILKETLKEINGNKALTVKVVEKYTDLFQIYKRGINRNTLINKIQAQEFSYIDKLALDSMNSEQQAELLTPNEHGVNAIMVAAIKQPNILEDLLVIMNKLNHDSIKAILLQMSQVDIKVFGRIFEAMIKSSKAKIAKDFLELYLSINPHAIIENIGPNLVAMHEQGYQLSEQEDLVLLYFNQLKRLSFEERMLGYYTLVQQLPKRQESLLEFIHELFRAEVSEITVERLLAILNIASADSEHTRTIIKQLSSEAINFQDAEGVSLLKRMIRLNNIGAIEALLLRSDLRLVLHEEIIFAARHEPSTLNTLLTHLRKLDESAQLLEFTAIARGETRDLFVVIEKLEKMEDSNNKLICSLIKTHLSDLTGVNLTNKLVEILNNCISNPELTSMIIESLPSDWVNIQDEHGNSLLMRMAATKNDAAISALVKRSELDLSIVNDAGDNVIKQVGFPLLDDSTSTPERRSIFKKLLDRVKDLDEIAQKKLFQHLNRQENFFSNLLTVALYVFNEEEDAFSAELIRKATPAQLNASDNAINGTALHFAIMNHREKTAMQLLKHGADVNVQNVYGTTQLHQLLRNINTCRPVELDNIEQLAKALINQESLNLSLLDNEHLSTLQVAMNMISQEQNAYKRALLEKIMMEIALKISKLPIERQREMLRDIPGGPYGSAMSFLFLGVKRFETFFEAIKQLNETQLIEHLSSPEFLSELARSKNAQVQWLNQARWFSRYRFTTPFTLNLTGCLLSDSNIRFKWSEYSHELFIVNYLKNCIPKKVNAVNLSGNELHLRSSAELYFYILKSIPLTVERVAINRNVFLDRAILLALFQNNLFCKTINTMSVADCKLYCRGLKENVSQFMELNPNFIKEVSKLSPEKRNAVLKGFDSSFLNAALSPVGSDLVTCRKNLVDLGAQMQTAPAAEIDYQMKESIKYCEKNNMSVLVQLFKNPRMNTKHLRDGSKKDIISFIKKLLSLPIGYTLETFLEQMKDPASALFRHFHQNHVAISAITELEVTESLSTQKKNLLLATIYCREIEILRLEGGALKEMMQVEKNRAVFRSLFQGGDFYKTLKSLSHSQVILICNALLPHLDLILKENPKIGNQLKILTEKNPKIARAVLESFDSPLLNALVNNSAPWDGTMFARPEYDGAMRAAILMENTHFILKVNEIRGVAMAHLPNSMGEVLLDGLDKLPKNHPDKVLFMRLMNERPSSTLRTYLETILPETTSSKFFCMPESELLIERARILERAERMAVTISAEIASLSTSQATVALKSKLSGLRAPGDSKEISDERPKGWSGK